MMNDKEERQAAILEILENNKSIKSQEELTLELRKMGIIASQSSICRDMYDLCIVKVRGELRVFPPELL